MCILFVYTEPEPKENGYRLIIASNRDEFYRRPAQILSQTEQVVGGRDMEAGREGGMWLGVSTKRTRQNVKFRFGALLNVTGEERKHGVQGRGFVVADYLNEETPPKAYMERLLHAPGPYNGFNFVAVELRDGEAAIHHCSNVTGSHSATEGTQIQGFGNTTPEHQLTKVKVGSKQFMDIIDRHNNVTCRQQLIDRLTDLLKSDEAHLPDEELERRQPAAYEYLSCIFVKMYNAGYGTRTHSIILVDYDWNVEFHELTMEEPIDDPQNPSWKTNVFRSRL